MADQWHVSWLKEGVERWNQRRRKVEFSPDLSGIRFFDFLPSDFRDAPKTSRYFERINLSDANLTGSDLSTLNFSKADFSGAILLNANMSKSNFDGAIFLNANLLGANASRSSFAVSVFTNADFSDVSLKDADIGRSIIIASNVSLEQIREASARPERIFPTQSAYQQYQEAGDGGANFLADRSEKAGSGRLGDELDRRKRKNRYDVFFGTNRCPVFERGSLVDFDSSKNSSLNYGVCEVIVPEGHRVGSLGSPLWRRLFNKQDDRIKIVGFISLNNDLFWDLIRQTSLRMKIREKPTIFVHGFNTSFKDAVLRAAQIGYDLGLGQGIGLFSWPSKGSIPAYSADEASAEASKYDLAKFIQQFVERSEQKSVNIISHSMGCRVTLGALELLSNGHKQVLKSVDQVILAAADVDSSIMPNLSVAALKYSRRTTSYISDQDKALSLSGWLHGYHRVGVMPPTFVISGMDTILVNDMSLGEFGHGYIGANRSVLGDIFSLLKSNAAPEDRHAVEPVSLQGIEYWRIRN